MSSGCGGWQPMAGKPAKKISINFGAPWSANPDGSRGTTRSSSKASRAGMYPCQPGQCRVRRMGARNRDSLAGSPPILRTCGGRWCAEAPMSPMRESMSLGGSSTDPTRHGEGELMNLTRWPVLLLLCLISAADAAEGSGAGTKWELGPGKTGDDFPIAVWLQAPANAAKYKAIGINTY